MAEQADVLVVGGGVIGLTAAYYLAREGARVTVVDQGDLGQQASWAGAGILPPGQPEHAPTPYGRLKAHSSAMYPGLSRALKEETGIDNGYVVCGGLELPEPGYDADVPAEEWVGEGVAFQALDGIGLRAVEPGLSPMLRRGYHLPGMAQVRNPRHLKALQAACARRRVALWPGCGARALLRKGRRIEGVESAAGTVSAGAVLVAAGAWSEGLLTQAGWRPGVRPVRGQIALLNTGREGVRPILLQGPRYVVPRPDGRVLVGSTEEDAGFDARPTAGGIAGLLAFAAGLLPGLAEAPLERCWAGLRPGSPDGMPFLGRVPGWDNLYVAAGHFRAGIQLAPATGLALASLMLGKPSPIDLGAFRLDRPSGNG